MPRFCCLTTCATLLPATPRLSPESILWPASPEAPHLTLAFVGEISTIDARRLSAALRPLCALTPRDITIGRIGTFDRQRILYAGLSPAESLDPVVNEVRSTITQLGLPLDDKPFRAHITLARDWRRGHPPMTLPARTVPLSGPVLMETVKDPRTGMIRYRQVL